MLSTLRESTLTGKLRLEAILNGQIPDAPPHWELVFQIENVMFGMDREVVLKEDQFSFQLDVNHRLVDEFDWAAIRGGYDLFEIERTNSLPQTASMKACLLKATK